MTEPDIPPPDEAQEPKLTRAELQQQVASYWLQGGVIHHLPYDPEAEQEQLQGGWNGLD